MFANKICSLLRILVFAYWSCAYWSYEVRIFLIAVAFTELRLVKILQKFTFSQTFLAIRYVHGPPTTQLNFFIQTGLGAIASLTSLIIYYYTCISTANHVFHGNMFNGNMGANVRSLMLSFSFSACCTFSMFFVTYSIFR